MSTSTQLSNVIGQECGLFRMRRQRGKTSSAANDLAWPGVPNPVKLYMGRASDAVARLFQAVLRSRRVSCKALIHTLRVVMFGLGFSSVDVEFSSPLRFPLD